MAGITSDFPFAVKHRGIERQSHRDHATRNVLLPFIIDVKLWNRMAVPAADSEREGDVFHRRVNFSSGAILEHFHILIELLGGFAFYIFGPGVPGGEAPRCCGPARQVWRST